MELSTFDEKKYLEANPDVAEAVAKGFFLSGLDHYKKYGIYEARPLRAFSREDKVFELVNKSGLGLEIGPSHNPIAPKKSGFNVHILDHLNALQLREKYKDHDVDIDKIEEVDFVWDGRPLNKLIGSENCYDYIIASHVIEHIPNLIVFLQECSSLLKSDGVISLVVPDKRYCFDHFSPLTTTGDLIDAYLEKRTRPSPGQVFNHFSNAAKLSGRIAWSSSHLSNDFKLCHSMLEVIQNYLSTINESCYIDVHCWRFIPNSFELLMSDLLVLGHIDLVVEKIFDTVGCEFYVTLKKVTQEHIQKNRIEVLSSIKKDLFKIGQV